MYVYMCCLKLNKIELLNIQICVLMKTARVLHIHSVSLYNKFAQVCFSINLTQLFKYLKNRMLISGTHMQK